MRKVEIAVEAPAADEFEMELERGGAIMSQAPASSSRTSGPQSSPRLSTASPRASGLELTYRRMDAQAALQEESQTAAMALAWIVPFAIAAGTALLLVKTLHRHGGRNFVALMPHAFDASSTMLSGAFALTSLVLAIALGFIAFRLEPRSYAMVGSSTLLVITSLAMVTVTLVSLEEHHAPADGALLIPYVLPLAILLLGLGIVGRGPSHLLRGGSGRGIAALVGIAGGALAFLAIETSKVARLF